MEIIKRYNSDYEDVAPIVTTDLESLKITEELNTITVAEFEIHKSATCLVDLKEEDELTFDNNRIFRQKDERLIVKEVHRLEDGNYEVYATQNVEELKNNVVAEYAPEYLLEDYQTQLQRASGWRFMWSWTTTPNNNFEKPAASVWDAFMSIIENTGAFCTFMNNGRYKQVNVFGSLATLQGRVDKRIKLFEGISLASYEKTSNTSEVVTRICPVGKDGLLLDGTIKQLGVIPNDNCWIENTEYYPKVVSRFVDFSDCETVQDLRASAQEYLLSVCKPSVSYSLKVRDLQRMTNNFAFPKLELGAVAEFQNDEGEVIEATIVKIEHDYLDPDNTNVELTSFAENFASANASARKQIDANTTAIQELKQSVGSGDYITQSGVRDGWYFEKYKSGKIVLRTRQKLTFGNTWSSVVGHYRAVQTLKMPFVIPYSSRVEMTGSAHSGGVYATVNSENEVTGTDAIEVIAYKETSGNATYNMNMSITVVGLSYIE